MKLVLDKKPRSPTIIEGFPGFGLVGTIAVEFLIKHLNAKPIGMVRSNELIPMAAIHESKVVEPIGIFPRLLDKFPEIKVNEEGNIHVNTTPVAS